MNILNIVPVSATIPNVAQYGCQGLQLKNSVKCLRLHYTYPIPLRPPARPNPNIVHNYCTYFKDVKNNTKY